MLQLFIGTEPRQYLAQRVLEASVRRKASVPVAITPLPCVDSGLDQRTGFSFNRWSVVERAEPGVAVYMDADIVVLDDIAQLLALERPTPILARVCDPTRYYTSVMVMDITRLKDASLPTFAQLVEDVKNRVYGYQSIMWAMRSSPYARYISGLHERWNAMDIVKPGTAAVHYTGLDRQPWKYSGHQYGGAFRTALQLALSEGSITRGELNREIELGHVRADILTNP